MDVLVNWLWQGSAVALAATALLRASRRMSATTRYHLWWVALVVVLVLPASSLQLPAPSFRQDALSAQSGDFAPKVSARSWKPGAGSVVLPALPGWTGALLVLLWSSWATISLWRTVGALVTLARAKRTSRPFPEACEGRLRTWLSLRSRGRRARLAVSDEVRAAAVLGLTSPSIALAPGTLVALNDEELDQIVVHEWAHVQRRDDIARLVQRVIVALAGLHPAVWWIDRQLHLERETACDDWAVNATGSARGFAVCLTKLAALPGRPDAVLLPAALLSSELTTRVVRLLDRRRNTSTTRTFGAPMVVAPVLGALALIIASEVVVTSPMAHDARHDSVAAVVAVATRAESAAAPAMSAMNVPGAAPANELRAGRPLRTLQGSARIPARTRAQAAAPTDASEQRATLAALPAHGPVHEGQLGAEDLPGTRIPASGNVMPAPVAGVVAPAGSQSPPSPTLWGAAAGAGVTVGQGSQKAAVATAGFFTRLSKSIAGVF